MATTPVVHSSTPTIEQISSLSLIAIPEREDKYPPIIRDENGYPQIAPEYAHADERQKTIALILARTGDPALFHKAKAIMRCGNLFRSLFYCEDGHAEIFRTCRCRNPFCPMKCSDAGARLAEYERRRKDSVAEMVSGKGMWIRLLLDYPDRTDDADILLTRKQEADAAFDRWREQSKRYLTSHGMTITYFINPTSHKTGLSIYCAGPTLDQGWLKRSWQTAAQRKCSAFIDYSKEPIESRTLLTNSFSGMESIAALPPEQLAKLTAAFQGEHLVRTLGAFRGLTVDDTLDELEPVAEAISLDDPRLTEEPMIPPGPACPHPECHKPMIKVLPGTSRFVMAPLEVIHSRTQRGFEVSGRHSSIRTLNRIWPSMYARQRDEWYKNDTRVLIDPGGGDYIISL